MHHNHISAELARDREDTQPCWFRKSGRYSSFSLKPRPSDSNISTQHIPTLSAQHLQTLAKRSQHLNITDRNIVMRNMLHAFGHHVATCCELKIELEHMPSRNIVAQEPGQTTVTSCNIHKCCMKNLATFKFEPTTPNMSQHFATRWPDAPNNVAICCDRLAGVKHPLPRLEHLSVSPQAYSKFESKMALA